MQKIVGFWLFLFVTLVVLPAKAELDASMLTSGTTEVRAWVNGDTLSASGIGVIAKSDQYNGYVLTSADVVSNFDRLTVSRSPGGPARVAQLINVSEQLALIKVNGLGGKALAFSSELPDVPAELWAASQGAVGLSVRQGYMVSKAAANQQFSLNVADADKGRSSVLVNECGQVLGMQLANSRVAIGTAALMRFMAVSNVIPSLSTSGCETAIQKARNNAAQAKLAAESAQREASLAQQAAESLAAQLKQSDQRNQQLELDAASAKETAKAAILAARAAQAEAEQTRIALEQQTATLQAETEALVKHLEQEREAAERRFRSALDAQQIAANQREDYLFAGLVGLSLILMAFLYLLLRRGPAAVIARIQPEVATSTDRSAPRPVNSETSDKASGLHEYVLEGRDEEGLSYLLRVSDTQLDAQGGVVIGREAHHKIDHVDVSRKHARLTMRQDRVFIEDLGSTNGTMVNGEAIDSKGPVSLRHGDQIVFGSVAMKLRLLAS